MLSLLRSLLVSLAGRQGPSARRTRSGVRWSLLDGLQRWGPPKRSPAARREHVHQGVKRGESGQGLCDKLDAGASEVVARQANSDEQRQGPVPSDNVV